MSVERPNIVWTVSEDCPPKFGCYGDPHAVTPNLDALATRGVRFAHAYSPAPVCALSRFGLITGVAPESHAPANHMRAVAAVPAWMRTYPELLRDLGYYCTNNAKTDYNAAVDPDAIWAESSTDAHWRARPEGMPFCAVFNIDGTHESSIFGSDDPDVDPRSIELPAYLPDTAEIRADFARHYLRIAAMDAALGVLYRQLDEDGLSDDTIIIHCSDHGGVTPRTKRYCYDEGTHVPLIIAAPERFAHLFPPAGTVIDAAVGTIRIPPTLIDLAGGEIPPYMSDRSLAGSVFDTATCHAFGARNRMDERNDMMRTVRDDRYRLIVNYTPYRPWGQHQAFSWIARGYQSWEREHLAGRLDPVQERFWRTKPGIELYDCVADPDELSNLADDPAYAQVRGRLAAVLRDHMIEVHDNGFLPEGSPVEGYDSSRVPGAYPLERLLDLTDAMVRLDPDDLPRFVAALDDTDATIRRWGAIAILSLGADGRSATDRLGRTLEIDPDPFVIVPVAEMLARWCDVPEAVGRLVDLLGPENDRPLRIEALSALTALELEAVRPHRDVVEAAAGDRDEYVGESARYLLELIDGTYRPDKILFAFAGS